MRSNRHPLREGFTLIELLVAVSIIGIVAAVAIPSVLRSRMSANSAAAAGALKTIAAAQTAYNTESQEHTYAPSLLELSTGSAVGDTQLISGDLGEGIKHGYMFDLAAGGFNQGAYYAWSAEAHPFLYQRTGVRSFYIDETGILLANDVQGGRGTKDMPEI